MAYDLGLSVEAQNDFLHMASSAESKSIIDAMAAIAANGDAQAAGTHETSVGRFRVTYVVRKSGRIVTVLRIERA
jgi:hypothetical protein